MTRWLSSKFKLSTSAARCLASGSYIDQVMYKNSMPIAAGLRVAGPVTPLSRCNQASIYACRFQGSWCH